MCVGYCIVALFSKQGSYVVYFALRGNINFIAYVCYETIVNLPLNYHTLVLLYISVYICVYLCICIHIASEVRVQKAMSSSFFC